MITRETLELAAKAAGCEIRELRGIICIGRRMLTNGDLWNAKPWNPEHDDGDSARLRTDLMLGSQFGETFVLVLNEKVAMYEFYDKHDDDKHAALRYATLMVAAEIGRRME